MGWHGRCGGVAGGRFTMPVAAQLMALNELGREELELFVAHTGEVHESSRPKLDRMKELDSFLEDKRVRCHQVDPSYGVACIAVCGSMALLP